MTSTQPFPPADDLRRLTTNRPADDEIPPLDLGFIATNPKLLLTAIADHADAWYWTRPWRKIAVRLTGIVVLLGLTMGLPFASVLVRQEKLTTFYTSLLAAPTDASGGIAATSSGSQDSPSANVNSDDDRTWIPGSASKVAMLAARRLLQLNGTDPRAHFLIAAGLGRGGKIDQARQVMSKVSPSDGRGFAPGHAWLAASYLATNRPDRDQATDSALVMNHLKQAMRWEGTSPQLRALYANELQRSGDHDAAAQTLAAAVKQEPRLVPRLANLAHRGDLIAQYRFQIDAARQTLINRVGEDAPSPDDLLPLISLALGDGELAQARVWIDALASVDAADPRLPRLRSEALRQEYRKTFVKTPQGIVLSLDLLDAALKEDPTNPAIDAEINDLLAYGVDVPDDFSRYLEQKITDGKATALTHLILAGNDVRRGTLAAAIPHLEIALKLAPGSVLIMNNLAYTLASADPAQVPRAITLIADAVQRVPNDPNLLETQGEIFLLADRPLDAAAVLEKAISIDNRRISSRERLAEAYAKAGLNELATRQQESVVRLKAESAPQPPQVSPTPQPTDTNPPSPKPDQRQRSSYSQPSGPNATDPPPAGKSGQPPAVD